MKNYDITAVPELKGVVYMLTNPLGERYIGSAVDLRNRMGKYRRGGHGLIGESIAKYGWENHTITILAFDIPDKNLLACEKAFQEKIQPELNLITVNAGGRVRFAESAKKKMSAAKMGVPKSPEHRANMSAAQKGRKHTPETRAKMSEAKKDVPKSAEHVANIQKARRETYHRKNHKRDKKIIGMRKKGKTLQAIADRVDLSVVHVQRICQQANK